ncbi:TetR/AcrR family transcriptional regulator [Paenibacillus sp. SC116]|uniref:TetR/AcrR family transcriptional regulator n=1 Tax=Paenibacillus sp. SC116 TaxID=2968986 RepID=UPI00215B4FB7|nr:TetR/AcrR family transcriptional regulator [Paenibacillus sp. SC116]MCR8843632.1 TetR/AcrR family transcriptional regulator [Paenibacillus sp. SC116]
MDRQGDRRVQRTRALLNEALLDLLIEKGYEAVTIQDLIDRANIGRSTFYFHFADKEELLKDNVDQLQVYLREQFAMRESDTSIEDFRFGFSLALLQHVQSHKMIYRATIGKQSGAQVLYHMRRMVTDLAREEIVGLVSSNNHAMIPQEVATEFTVNTLITLISWWMEQKKPCSAKEVDKMFHQLVLRGINNGN